MDEGFKGEWIYWFNPTCYSLCDLYGFHLLIDTPIDLMHNLPMNPVKKHLRCLFDTGNVNRDLIESRLSNFLWTPEMRASKYPSGIMSRLGYWKAEDYQKFCFPASEVILYDQMPADEFQCWSLLVEMVTMVFNCCRTHGWTYRDIKLFIKLAWHHNILVEEVFGLEACVVTELNLIHVADDMYRFSSPDYWVFDLERAVKRYVNQSTNRRNIEKMYSDNETRREVLQNLDITRNRKNAPVLTQKEIDSAITLRQVSSLNKGNYLIAHAHDSLTDIQGGILVGNENKGFQEISESERHEIFQDMRDRGAEIEYSTLPSATKRCKSFLKPGKEPGVPHMVYRKGENAILLVNNEERTGKISDIHSEIIENRDDIGSVHLFVEVQLYGQVTDDNGHPKYHPGSHSQCLFLSQTIQMVNTIDVLRKVILYPDQSILHQVVLIDFDMPSLPPQKQCVVVPFYPKKNDMVSNRMTRELDFTSLRNIQDGLEEESLSRKVQHSIVYIGTAS